MVEGIKVWRWDYATKELLKETSMAYPDERNPEKLLMPPRSTTEKPPRKKKGYKVFRNETESRWMSIKSQS